MKIQDWSSFHLEQPHVKSQDAFMTAYDSLTDKSERESWLYLGAKADLNLPYTNFNQVVDTLRDREINAPSHFVRDTVYWAMHKDEMVGRISIRHELNDFLKKVGGHIGYIVHPRWRNQGVANWMLSEILKTSKAKEINRLLLTCNDGNIASEKTIIKNGGVFAETVLTEAQELKKHFWITLKS